jgi:hypothetical protein
LMSTITKTLKRAVKLSATADDNFPELARCLAEIYSEDRRMWRQFLELSGVKSRKAYYLVELGKHLGTHRITDERLRRIGWTKAQVIAAHMEKGPGANVTGLLAQAEKNTVEGLKAIIDGKNPEVKAHRVMLNFSPAQYRELAKALLANGGRPSGRGLANKEAAIIKIIRIAADAAPETSANTGRRVGKRLPSEVSKKKKSRPRFGLAK